MKLFQYYHLPWVRSVRSFARSTGLIRMLRRVAGSSVGFHEDVFENAMRAAIRPGDTVWDIGAHVGAYSRLFLEWTEPGGTVVPFEPLPAAFATLTDSVAKLGAASGRCLPQNVAITDQDGEVSFTLETSAQDDISTVSHISDGAAAAGTAQQTIRAYRVDTVVGKLGLPAPQVTKIDVEGYEEEVLLGGAATFSRPEHRALFLEIHFTRLTVRQRDDAPARIVQLLKS